MYGVVLIRSNYGGRAPAGMPRVAAGGCWLSADAEFWKSCGRCGFCRAMGGQDRTQNSPATLGDVLYSKSKTTVADEAWAALVQSIAAGDQLALHELYEMAHRMVFTLIIESRPTWKPLKSSPSTCSMTSGGVHRVRDHVAFDFDRRGHHPRLCGPVSGPSIGRDGAAL
jgi:hypothetical protein